jgi:hypothetical protein
MVFDTWIYGELTLPAEAFSRWLSQPLGAEGNGPDFVAHDTGCVGREPLVILEGLHQLNLSPREFLGIGADTGRISVRGLLTDNALLKSQGLLTALFASAVGHGGDGRLVVAGRRGTTFGYEVLVCCGAVRARALDQTERRAFLDSRACAELIVRERENLKQVLEMVNPGPTAPRPQPSPPAAVASSSEVAI